MISQFHDIINPLEKLAMSFAKPKFKCSLKQIIDRLTPMDPEITEVDRFKKDYPRHLRHKDNLVTLFIDPIKI